MMGLGRKTHDGKKADQETQSPVTKVFKEIMLSENGHKSEKVNLLKEKREKKKKRYSKQKSQPEVKSRDTSVTECHLKPVQNSYSQPKSQSVFRDEKRDSWWTWGGHAERNEEDTYSCVSCALKRMVTQRSGIMSCLVTLLVISGVVAIYLVISTMPKTCIEKHGNDELLRSYGVAKTATEGDRRERRSEIDLEGKDERDRSIWDESKSRLMSGLSDLYNADFVESGLHGGEIMPESSRRLSTDLSTVIDPNKLSEGYGSNQLRNFYKKLIQTDLQIKSLKKSIREVKPAGNEYADLSRAKRSLKFVPRRHARADKEAGHQSFRGEHLFHLSPPVTKVPAAKAIKDKRCANDSGTSGFFLENKKLVVKYKQYPERHKAAYHSHPRLGNVRMRSSKENDPFHPMLNDTERLNDLLTRLVQKKVPDAIFDPFGLRTANPLLTTGRYSPFDDYVLADQPIDLPQLKKNKFAFKAKTTTMPPQTHRATSVVSSSTILNTEAKNSLDLISQVPNIRRLLQVAVNEENESANDEEEEKQNMRGASESDLQTANKHHPPAIHNANWKGPMPLYPDELNSMIKQAAMDHTSKEDIPVYKDNVGDNAKDISDTEYVEDYFNSKYDKLVKMAQAYSDYGVLEDKKDMKVEKNDNLENRVKLSVQKGLGLIGRLQKNYALDPEGIRIEYKPKSAVPTASMEKIRPKDFFKLGNHIKVHKPHLAQDASSLNPVKNFQLTNDNQEKSKLLKSSTDNIDISLSEHEPIHRHKRTLMSVKEDPSVENPTEVDKAQTEDSKIGILQSASGNTVDKYAYNPYTLIHRPSSISDATNIGSETNGSTNEVLTEPNGVSISVPEIIATESIETIHVKTNAKSNNTKMKPVDIFELITDWFKILNALEMDENHANDTGFFTDILAMVKPKTNLVIPLHHYITTSVETTTRKPLYPLFDSEMVENIGHRSRVLMSLDEKPDNATVKEDEINIKSSGAKVTDDEPTKATPKEVNIFTNALNVSDALDKKTDAAAVANKTVRKRRASDNSDLIFWNDMYDDEYGVTDPLDDAVRDKHSAKFNDAVSKSKNWLGMKLKRIADSVRNPKKVWKARRFVKLSGKNNTIFKRDASSEDSNRQSFAALTATMKKVCREAAQAVYQTKNMEVPLNPLGSKAASSLMQQLVGLMADLVDIQVQQKTCVPLPPDLRTFLVWLTSPNPEENNPQMESFDELSNSVVTGQPTPSFPYVSSSEMYPFDVRTECLGTIHDVQDLIRLYDEMSEEDKSKMSGVREYLENQLDFLHKQLSAFDGINEPSMMQIIRKRRRAERRPRNARKLNRFLKSGKKLTRSTGSSDTLDSLTDNGTTRPDRNSATLRAVRGTEDRNVKRALPEADKTWADTVNATVGNRPI